MEKKGLSPFAPDRRIREMNRRYPSLWTDLRKGYADPGKILRPKSGGIELLGSVPEWYIMPTLFPFLIIDRQVRRALLSDAHGRADDHGQHLHLALQ